MDSQQSQHDYFAQAGQLVEAAKGALVVTNDEQQKMAVTWLGQAKACSKALVSMKKTALEPVEAKIKSIKGEYDTTIAPLDEVARYVRASVDGYANLQLRRQQEEERRRRAAEEDARLKAAAAAEERAAAARRESEAARQAGDAVAAAQAEQQAAQQQEEADAALTHAAEAPAPAIRPRPRGEPRARPDARPDAHRPDGTAPAAPLTRWSQTRCWRRRRRTG